MHWLAVFALLGTAHTAPWAAGRLLGSRSAAPIDGGAVLPEAPRLYGAHRTWRGALAALGLCTLIAALLGYPVRMALAFAPLTMGADLFSSMPKRRLRLMPGREAPGLDLIPAALLPVLGLATALGIDCTGHRLNEHRAAHDVIRTVRPGHDSASEPPQPLRVPGNGGVDANRDGSDPGTLTHRVAGDLLRRYDPPGVLVRVYAAAGMPAQTEESLYRLAPGNGKQLQRSRDVFQMSSAWQVRAPQRREPAIRWKRGSACAVFNGAERATPAQRCLLPAHSGAVRVRLLRTNWMCSRS